MSAKSGGTGPPSNRVIENLPVMATDASNAAKRQLVSRKRDVELVFAQPMAAAGVVAAIVSSVNPPEQIECIQQLNAKKFFLSFNSARSAECFHRIVAPTLRIAGSTPSSKWLGAERRKIRVAFLPYAVDNRELIDALKPYGQVIEVMEETYADTPVRIKTGTRIVDMEMTSPVPNIITVCGFSVPVTYKGVVLQCRRCLLTGHLKADCNTPYCDRCKSFGHCEEVCNAPCLKCKAPDHHWKSCSVRSYAFAAASGGIAAASGGTAAAPTATTATEPLLAECPTTPAERMDQLDNAAAVEHSTSSITIDDDFDSATEHNSECEIDAVRPRVSNKERGKADDTAGTLGEVACQPTEETASSGPWEGAKLRNKKRKNVSITPDKVPDPKKAMSGSGPQVK